jgi:hypothetical protein
VRQLDPVRLFRAFPATGWENFVCADHFSCHPGRRASRPGT